MSEQRLANVATDLEYHQWEAEPIVNLTRVPIVQNVNLFHLNRDSALCPIQVPVIDPSGHFDGLAP